MCRIAATIPEGILPPLRRSADGNGQPKRHTFAGQASSIAEPVQLSLSSHRARQFACSRFCEVTIEAQPLTGYRERLPVFPRAAEAAQSHAARLHIGHGRRGICAS